MISPEMRARNFC